jgi:hypothetical protein
MGLGNCASRGGQPKCPTVRKAPHLGEGEKLETLIQEHWTNSKEGGEGGDGVAMGI